MSRHCVFALVAAFAVAAKAQVPYAQPMVSITIDDGFQSQFDLARPALQRHGFKATYFLISQPIAQGWSGYLTLAEARTLAAEGDEIGDHTATHPHLTTLTAQQVRDELASSKSWLEANLGVKVKSFASPYGDFDDGVVAQAQPLFDTHRTQQMGRAFSEDDRYRLRGAYVRSTTTVDEIEGWIDQTVQEKSWLMLTFHEFTTGTPARETQYALANFVAVLDYLKARGVKVVTVAQGAEKLGSGRDTGAPRWVYGDAFGNDVENRSWGNDAPGEKQVVHDGRRAIGFDASNWGGLAFHLYGGIDAATWKVVELWIHGGATGGQKLQLGLYAAGRLVGAVPLDVALGHPIAGNAWQLVSVPLEKLGLATGTADELHVEDVSGTTQGAVTIDSVVLRKAAAPPPPPASLVIYDDALRNGFEDWSWAVHDLAQGANVHSGSAAISFQPKDWAGLYFHSAGVDTTGWGSVELWVNGGAAGGQRLALRAWDGKSALGLVALPPLKAGTWTRVVVPLRALNLAGKQLKDLYLQSWGGGTGTAYVDDVRLIR